MGGCPAETRIFVARLPWKRNGTWDACWQEAPEPVALPAPSWTAAMVDVNSIRWLVSGQRDHRAPLAGNII